MSSTDFSLACVAAIACALSCASGARADDVKKRAMRIAVRPMEASAEDARLARVVDAALVAEMRKLQGASVIGLDEVKAMLDLEAQKQLTGCSEASCIAEIAAALGADVLVTGQIALVNGERVFGVKRIEQQTAAATDVNLRLEDLGGDECLASVGSVVEQLFPDFPLRTGETRGVSDVIVARLHPPPLPPAVTIAAFVTTGVIGAVSVGALVVNVSTFAREQGAVDSARTEKRSVAGASIAESNQALGISLGVAGVAGAVALGLAAASAVAVLFTDWDGSDDDAP